jgi:uncharacterized membrane protein HdeD (DUF308 family)
MLLIILGIVDILAGISMLYPNLLAFYIGVLILLKGVSSMFGIATKNAGIAIMGVIDIVAGLSLVFSFSIPLLWLILIVKGAFSLASGLGN